MHGSDYTFLEKLISQHQHPHPKPTHIYKPSTQGSLWWQLVVYRSLSLKMPGSSLWIQCTSTVSPKKYAHGFCFAVLCCGYTLTDFPISIRLTSLALWQSNDCPSASKATLMNMDKYFMWIHYERLHNHNKAKPNKTVCIFLGIYCRSLSLKMPGSSLWIQCTSRCNIGYCV